MESKHKKRTLKGFISAIMVSLAASFMLMVFAPIEIYYSNQSQFWFEIKQLIPVVLIMFGSALIISMIILFVAYLINEKFFGVILSLYFVAFLSTYVQGNFLVKHLPGLDGTEPVWKNYIKEDIKTTAVWLIILIIVIICICVFKMEKVKNAIGVISICMFLMMAVTLVTVIMTTKVESKDYEMVYTDKDELVMSEDTNFIILLFDAMDAGTYKALSEQHPEYADIFKDFTFFDDTVCAYTFTKQSIPFILSGKWYENEKPFETYAAEAYSESPLLTKLQDKGYKMGLYENETYTTDPEMYMFDNVIKNRTDISSYVTFIKRELQITGYKYAPFILKRFCMVGTEDFEDFRENPDGCEAYSLDNTVFYDKLKNNDIDKTEDKVFKFIHLWGAHVPFSYDKDMNIIEDGTYEQNVEACVTMADEYIKKLKESDTYDNSVIIIMSDHGFYHTDEPSNRQHPLFMVKGVGEHHDYMVSNVPVSYDDLQEAYSRLLDGKPSEDIFDAKEGDNRKRRYMYYEYLHDEVMEEYYQEGYAGDMDTLKASGKKYIYGE